MNARRTGFTIVELLIVIVVIGILAAITIVAYNGIQAKATVASLQSDLENDNKQLIAYLTTSSTGFPTAIDCSSTPAANTICLKSSGTTTYQYSVNNASLSSPTYCITATNNTTSYYIGSSTSAPAVGACPGHGAGGVAAITNQVTNPTFATSTSGWGLSTGTGGVAAPSLQPSGGVDGGTYYRATWSTTPTAGASYVSKGTGGGDATRDTLVNGGQTYNFNGWVRTSWATTIGMYAAPYDATNVATAGNVSPGTAIPANTWTRLNVSFTPASTAVSTVVRFIINSPTSIPVNGTFDIDQIMVTQGAAPYTYADPIINSNWVWNGTPNASSSTGPAV